MSQVRKIVQCGESIPSSPIPVAGVTDVMSEIADAVAANLERLRRQETPSHRAV